MAGRRWPPGRRRGCRPAAGSRAPWTIRGRDPAGPNTPPAGAAVARSCPARRAPGAQPPGWRTRPCGRLASSPWSSTAGRFFGRPFLGSPGTSPASPIRAAPGCRDRAAASAFVPERAGTTTVRPPADSPASTPSATVRASKARTITAVSPRRSSARSVTASARATHDRIPRPSARAGCPPRSSAWAQRTASGVSPCCLTRRASVPHGMARATCAVPATAGSHEPRTVIAGG